MTSNTAYATHHLPPHPPPPPPQWNQIHGEEARHHGSRRSDNNNNNNSKDSRWLTLEVCMDHMKGSCQKKDEECMMAHLPLSGSSSSSSSSSSSLSSSSEFSLDRRIMCCYDFIKGKCYRKDPPCKFFHPPPHLREVLLHNGRQNLLLRSHLRSQPHYNGVPYVPQTVLPMVYNPTILNPMMASKMSDGTQVQFLSNHCVINQGGVAYFYPFIVGTDGWVTIPTNSIHGCQLVPSPPLHGSLKQVDQSVIHMGGYDDVISSPWLQNSYPVHQAAMCSPLCFGYGQNLMKRPSTCDVNKVQ